MLIENKGFDNDTISSYAERMSDSGANFILAQDDEQSDEFKHFYFIGVYEGRRVIYDTALYTLRLHHNSELYEIAEHRAAKHFPEFSSIHYDEDENGDLIALDDRQEEIGLFMAEVIMELEEEGEVKVHEFIDLDPHVDFGIGLDVALNVDQIDEQVITRFVDEFNDDTLELDDTLYTFQMEDGEMVD
jgi:hypothetical protein